MPSQVSQSSVAGTGIGAGILVMPCGQIGRVVKACTSVTLPISPDHRISAATRAPLFEYPWFPICVATPYLAAASVNCRASQTVRVSGFST